MRIRTSTPSYRGTAPDVSMRAPEGAEFGGVKAWAP